MNAVIHELRTLVLVIVGGAMCVIGSKMGDDVTRSLGVGIVMGALGMSLPGIQRDPHSRSRITDDPPPPTGRSSDR